MELRLETLMSYAAILHVSTTADFYPLGRTTPSLWRKPVQMSKAYCLVLHDETFIAKVPFPVYSLLLG